MSPNPLAVVLPHDVFVVGVSVALFTVVLLAGLLIWSRVQLANERKITAYLRDREVW